MKREEAFRKMFDELNSFVEALKNEEKEMDTMNKQEEAIKRLVAAKAAMEKENQETAESLIKDPLFGRTADIIAKRFAAKLEDKETSEGLTGDPETDKVVDAFVDMLLDKTIAIIFPNKVVEESPCDDCAFKDDCEACVEDDDEDEYEDDEEDEEDEDEDEDNEADSHHKVSIIVDGDKVSVLMDDVLVKEATIDTDK